MRRYSDPIEVRSVLVTALAEVMTPGSGCTTPGSDPGPGRDRGRDTGRDRGPDDGLALPHVPPGTPSASPGAPLTTPQAFIWQGRLYVVRRILAHWRERRAWWREALDPVPGQATGIDVASREHQVWRVEASAGRSLGSGVFDLVHDDVPHLGESDWRLVGVSD